MVSCAKPRLPVNRPLSGTLKIHRETTDDFRSSYSTQQATKKQTSLITLGDGAPTSTVSLPLPFASFPLNASPRSPDKNSSNLTRSICDPANLKCKINSMGKHPTVPASWRIAASLTRNQTPGFQASRTDHRSKGRWHGCDQVCTTSGIWWPTGTTTSSSVEPEPSLATCVSTIWSGLLCYSIRRPSIPGIRTRHSTTFASRLNQFDSVCSGLPPASVSSYRHLYTWKLPAAGWLLYPNL